MDVRSAGFIAFMKDVDEYPLIVLKLRLITLALLSIVRPETIASICV
uniref:Uncharacterized protein n=1 Tax=viral metagenome TaxID=1070528 RepID=A0A6C0CTF3_9ZZZZ